MVRISNELANALLAAQIAADELLDDATLGLFTNAWDFTVEPVTADLTAPTFTGYAPAAIAAWTVQVDEFGNRYVTPGPISFTCTAVTDLPQIIRGWYIRKETTNEFLAGGLLDDPITVSQDDQTFHVVATVPVEAKQPLSTGHAAIM